MAFTPIFNSFQQKPLSQYFRGGSLVSFQTMLRDQLTIPTWLMVGALLQGLFSFLPYRNISLVAPVALVILYKTVAAMLQTVGVLKNPYLEGTMGQRTAIMYANEHGHYENPGDREVCAIMLASRSNHPLGMFAPGVKDVGDRFKAMVSELESDPTAHGFLGASTWLNSGDRGYTSETMVFIYFASMHHLHEYSHGKMHTETMQWWQANLHRLRHLGIMHEVFAAPKHASEGVYINYHPTGLGATFTEAEVDGEKVWVSPLVEGKGKMRYSKGRMGRQFSEEKEWAAFEEAFVDV
ncbi:uncharacterized protein LTR77_011125 [Saxophila tyrrhenica]|uniref:Uncharacterized protein n=1 Tax=Saxophila tyrrhenica TaxID=1690608 RepID=A0AAV9NW33_9PEZI|nr:hypothetical protein LTR77_011125 [Saxophila tyrrhenica]